MGAPRIVSLLPFVDAPGGDEPDVLAPFRERDMIQVSSQWAQEMEPLFPIIAPGIFFNKPQRIGKARDDIKEINVMPLHIALSLGFIPFIAHAILYAQGVGLCQGASY